MVKPFSHEQSGTPHDLKQITILQLALHSFILQLCQITLQMPMVKFASGVFMSIESRFRVLIKVITVNKLWPSSSFLKCG